MIWNTYGPISSAVQPVLGWGDGMLALLANWGCICYLIAFLPTAWLFSRGIRIACITTAALITVSSAVRLITVHRPEVRYLTHFGQILNGLAGPVAMSVGPSLSAAWFPLHQRVTATAIVGLANYIGLALSFLIGPLLVPERKPPLERHDLEGIKQDVSCRIGNCESRKGCGGIGDSEHNGHKDRDDRSLT